MLSEQGFSLCDPKDGPRAARLNMASRKIGVGNVLSRFVGKMP